MAHGSLLACLEDINTPPVTIIIRSPESEGEKWLKRCQQPFNPQRMIYAIPAQATDLPESIQSKFADQDKTLAYKCQGMSCEAPIDQLDKLL